MKAIKFDKYPYCYEISFFNSKFSIKWARRGTIWTYNAPNHYKYRYRKDLLISLDRTYARGVGYIYAIHIGPLKIDYLAF